MSNECFIRCATLSRYSHGKKGDVHLHNVTAAWDNPRIYVDKQISCMWWLNVHEKHAFINRYLIMNYYSHVTILLQKDRRKFTYKSHPLFPLLWDIHTWKYKKKQCNSLTQLGKENFFDAGLSFAKAWSQDNHAAFLFLLSKYKLAFIKVQQEIKSTI